MTTVPGTPEGPKYAILRLLARGELTPAELAQRLGVTPTAVRQHLGALAALGLVDRRRVPTGPSRPPDRYRLSAAGRRVFPKRYDVLASELVEALFERDGAAETLGLVAAAARRLADQATPVVADATGAERWTRLVAWLEQEFAWEADATPPDGSPGRIVIHQCPFMDVSSHHPAVCGRFFGSLIESLDNTVVVEHLPDASEEACCALVVRARDTERSS